MVKYSWLPSDELVEKTQSVMIGKQNLIIPYKVSYLIWWLEGNEKSSFKLAETMVIFDVDKGVSDKGDIIEDFQAYFMNEKWAITPEMNGRILLCRKVSK